MSGLGIGDLHSTVIMEEGNIFIKPNATPQKFKTIVNGQIVSEKVQLKHGDKVLFGNNNLFVILFPGGDIGDQDLDYESCMKKMMSNQIGFL